jgi:hypothetical protein
MIFPGCVWTIAVAGLPLIGPSGLLQPPIRINFHCARITYVIAGQIICHLPPSWPARDLPPSPGMRLARGAFVVADRRRGSRIRSCNLVEEKPCCLSYRGWFAQSAAQAHPTAALSGETSWPPQVKAASPTWEPNCPRRGRLLARTAGVNTSLLKREAVKPAPGAAIGRRRGPMCGAVSCCIGPDHVRYTTALPAASTKTDS